ncbi:MAG: hypothetical protein HYX35_05055 [Proteobacteria bacterium]|nr:hypothetical protein [Pseudomonadota bacterium]
MEKIKCSLAILASFISIDPSLAAEGPQKNLPSQTLEDINTKEQATINFVNKAIDYYIDHGLEESIGSFRDQNGPFCKKYTYGYGGINVATTEGVLLSSCKYPGLVGSNILAWRSPDGRLINQDLFKAAKESPYGAETPQNITNLNPMTGKASAYRHFARSVNGLVFFSHIYNNAPLHKDLVPSEDIARAQDPKNAKPVDLNVVCLK